MMQRKLCVAITVVVVLLLDLAAGWRVKTLTPPGQRPKPYRRSSSSRKPVAIKMKAPDPTWNKSLVAEWEEYWKDYGVDEEPPDKERWTRKLPVVAIVGRPNVGKTRIANRLMKSVDPVHAPGIAFDEVGITRDRIYGYSTWNGRDFAVVDTGGIILDDSETSSFQQEIANQSLTGIEEASVVLLVVDGMEGCCQLDRDIAMLLRKKSVPTIVLVNKCEAPGSGDLQAHDFWSLGLGTPWPVSGVHGSGMGDALDEVVRMLPPERVQTKQEKVEKEIRIAIVGRPNVGKTSLLNQLIGKERSIVSDIEGTTRDTIVHSVVNNGTKFTFIDTGGLFRRSVLEKGLEELILQAVDRAILRSDVCLLVIDISQGLTKVEGRLAKWIIKKQRPCVVVYNKWDLVPDRNSKKMKSLKNDLERKLPKDILNWTEPLFISAKQGLRKERVFDAVRAVTGKLIQRLKDEGAEEWSWRQRFEYSRDQRERFGISDEEARVRLNRWGRPR